MGSLDNGLGLGLLRWRRLRGFRGGSRVLVEDAVLVIVLLLGDGRRLGFRSRRSRSRRSRSNAGGRLRSLRLPTAEVEGGVGLNALGDGLNLGHPLDLGDDLLAFVEIMVRLVTALVHLDMRVVGVVDVRLGSDSGDKKCRGSERSGSLHGDGCLLIVAKKAQLCMYTSTWSTAESR